MPGEAEYIASKLGIPFKEFIDRYVRTIKYGKHRIYGLLDSCPFLNGAGNRCELEKTNCKIITCLVYPVTLGYPGDSRRVFLDDEDCPMAHSVSEDYKQKAFGLLDLVKEQLPDWWLEFNAEYCWPLYDYEKLKLFRDRQEIKLEELKRCVIT